ncbi:MAG TPA: hypothetical protein DCR44_00625 [Acholeplasmatales bacterium]|nr:MAG: hypothetical protein A2Y16_03345 [Tenericutes bacterium GWF2_57_13]HAQ55903.1 hypothetical protein [Acholeplasmatales bacterium]
MDSFNQETRTNIETAVLAFLKTKGKIERKLIFAPAYEALHVTPEDIKDNVPSGNYSKAKSYIGMIVSELVNDKQIAIDAENKLSVIAIEAAAPTPVEAPKKKPAKPAVKPVKKAVDEPVIPAVSIVNATKPEAEPSAKTKAMRVRKALTERILAGFLSPAEANDSDPESLAGVLRSLTGAVLKNHPELQDAAADVVYDTVRAELERAKVVKEKILNRKPEIIAAAETPVALVKAVAPVQKPVKPKPIKVKKSSVIELPPVGPVFPIESIDRLIRETFVKHAQCVTGKITKETYDRHLIAAISHLFGEGEEFFETFSFMLIKKLYGSAIIREHYAPGPDDEGVDGEFLIEDAVGFREQVMMQAKTKKNDKPSISMKILREYVGVMHIRNADKCIIISNSSITKDAREAAKRLINVMLIGDKELFELMKKTRFGITVEAGIEKIDLPALIDLIRVK